MASPERQRDQALALAAALQCLLQVRSIATTGGWDAAQAAPCIGGLLAPFDGDVAMQYGGAEPLLPGLRELVSHLINPHDPELTRYLVAVMHLERRLMRRRDMLDRLAGGLRQAAEQAEYFEMLHENVVRNLGHLYTETLSTLRPRIVVRGERTHLEDPFRAALIRSLLLAALRAVSLWRAAGGSRWNLVLGRRSLIAAAKRLLAR